MSTNKPFCGFIEYYDHNLNGYVDIFICFIGVILNMFNLMVFTRKNMISSANLIFTHLAVADLLNLLASILYSWIYFFRSSQKDDENQTYIIAVMYIGSISLMNTLRYMCVFFTVMLAIWRYIAVAQPLKARYWCTMRITRNAVIACYITSVLLSAPMYFSYNIVSYNSTAEKVIYYIPRQKENSIIPAITFSIKAVLQQFLPSVVLPIFSYRMIVPLLTNKGPNNEVRTSCSTFQHRARNAKVKQQTERSITITLTVVVLFWITQIPLGVYNLIERMLPDIYNKWDDDQRKCYWRYVMVLSAGTFYYINMSMSFVVYNAMSQNFRTTFLSLFNSGRITFQKMNVFHLIRTRKIHTSLEEGQTLSTPSNGFSNKTT